MTKMEVYNKLSKTECSFLANVILCHHSNPAKKLKGLYKLVSNGHVVSLAQFSIDTLLVDGQVVSFSSLEG